MLGAISPVRAQCIPRAACLSSLIASLAKLSGPVGLGSSLEILVYVLRNNHSSMNSSTGPLFMTLEDHIGSRVTSLPRTYSQYGSRVVYAMSQRVVPETNYIYKAITPRR